MGAGEERVGIGVLTRRERVYGRERNSKEGEEKEKGPSPWI